MKRFSDLGIVSTAENKIFDCPQISINEIVNCEIKVLEYQSGVKTAFGDGRMVVLIEHDGSRKKFFTNCTAIKSDLESVPCCDFPFITVIKTIKHGKGASYKFT